MSVISPVKVLNCFNYDGGQIFELEFCNILIGAEKKHAYQWYLVHACYRSELRFISRSDSIRVFEFTDVFTPELIWTVKLDTDMMMMQLSHHDESCSITHSISLQGKCE